MSARVKRYLLIGAVLLFFTIVLCSGCDRDRSVANNYEQNEIYASNKPIYITPVDVKEIFDHSKLIIVKYKIQGARFDRIVFSILSPDGIKMISKSNGDIENDGILEFSFQMDDAFLEGSIKIQVEGYLGERTEIYNKSLYLLHEGDYDYIDYASYDGLSKYSERIRKNLDEIDR